MWLALFTRAQERGARFWAFDLPAARSKRNPFPTTPDDAGHQRNFNRIEVEGVDPNEVELMFQKFEGAAAQPMRRLASRAVGTANTGSPTLFLSNAERRDLCTLLGAQRVRGPDAAATFDEAFSAEAIAFMQTMASSEEAFSRAMARNPVEGFTRADVVALLADPGFRWVLDRATHFKELLPRIVEEGDRFCNACTWQAWVAPSSGPYFIMTDAPIITIERPGTDPPPVVGEITVVPLSYRVALVGHPRAHGERLTEMGVGSVTPETVASINDALVASTHRFVWSVEDHFFVGGDELVHSDAVLDRAKLVVKARKRLAQRAARRRVRRHR